MDLRRRGIRVVRLFKDNIYGSPQASFDHAKAYRDAVMSVLPPATNHEQAVLLRKNNKSGISGVRHVELAEDEAWEASLLNRTEHKREKFSVREYGEEQAKAMAIAQRRKWLEELPVKHLAYAEHSEEMTRQHFGEPVICSVAYATGASSRHAGKSFGKYRSGGTTGRRTACLLKRQLIKLIVARLRQRRPMETGGTHAFQQAERDRPDIARGQGPDLDRLVTRNDEIRQKPHGGLVIAEILDNRLNLSRLVDEDGDDEWLHRSGQAVDEADDEQE
ncbi:hypothetical protein RvVAT039_pl01470 (plasmid) [Agrobacterium vitis]|nr:hypothetical protein RvVAT039_pl01470 [Agrobacterium vitis]